MSELQKDLHDLALLLDKSEKDNKILKADNERLKSDLQEYIDGVNESDKKIKFWIRVIKVIIEAIANYYKIPFIDKLLDRIVEENMVTKEVQKARIPF